MKRLTRTAADAVEFAEIDNDVLNGPDRGCETRVYSVTMGAKRGDMSIDAWLTLGAKLTAGPVDETLAVVGVDQVVDGLEALGADNVRPANITCDAGDFNEDSIELVFGYSVFL